MQTVSQLLDQKYYVTNTYKWFKVLNTNAFEKKFKIYDLDWRCIYPWNFNSKSEAFTFIRNNYEELNERKSY